MIIKNSRHAPPRASAMIEALRGLGYNTATALADIRASLKIPPRQRWYNVMNDQS